jgi:hypothetical protein
VRWTNNGGELIRAVVTMQQLLEAGFTMDTDPEKELQYGALYIYGRNALHH